jgi:hypothetical protein
VVGITAAVSAGASEDGKGGATVAPAGKPDANLRFEQRPARSVRCRRRSDGRPVSVAASIEFGR